MGRTEGHGLQDRLPTPEPEEQVRSVLADDTGRLGEAEIPREEDRLLVSLPVGLEAIQIGHETLGDRGEGELRVDLQGTIESVSIGEQLPGSCAHGFPDGVDRVGADLAPGCGCVSPVALEVGGRRMHGLEDVEAGHGPGRAPSALPLEADDDGGALELVDQASGCDPDDPLVPALPRHHGHRPLLGVVEPASLGARCYQELTLELLAGSIQLVEAARVLPRRSEVLGQEDLDGPCGAVDAA